MSSDQSLSVPTSAALAATQRQRNNLADENATLWAFVEQLTAERDQLAAEVEKLRADAAIGGA